MDSNDLTAVPVGDDGLTAEERAATTAAIERAAAIVGALEPRRADPNAPYACAECGHLHYEGKGVWSTCPIDGCDCVGQDEPDHGFTAEEEAAAEERYYAFLGGQARGEINEELSYEAYLELGEEAV